MVLIPSLPRFWHTVFYKMCDVAGAGYVKEMDRHAWETQGSGSSLQPLGEGRSGNQRRR